MVLIIAGT